MNKQDPVLERIKVLRKAKGITQLDMSDKIGMAKNNYGKVENGHIELTVNRLYEIAEILGVSAISLLSDTATSIETINEEEIKYLRSEKAKFDKLLIDVAPLFGFIVKLFQKENGIKEEAVVPEEKLSDEFRASLAQSLKDVKWSELK